MRCHPCGEAFNGERQEDGTHVACAAAVVAASAAIHCFEHGGHASMDRCVSCRVVIKRSGRLAGLEQRYGSASAIPAAAMAGFRDGSAVMA